MLRVLAQTGNELGQNLHAEWGQDTEIHGGGGNDSVFGSTGNDTFYGDKGDDYLSGGDGSDTYIFNSGDGNDVIDDYTSSYGTDRNILRFGEGIRPEEIASSVVDECLVLSLNNGRDSITLQYLLTEVQFTDGTVWNKDYLTQLLSARPAINDNGQDLYTEAGGGEIYAGRGDDYLSGGAGNDILAGGLGDDTLKGNGGSDVYIFNRGDGQDTINSYGNGSTDKKEILRFGENINPQDIIISVISSTELVFSIRDSSDTVTVMCDLQYSTDFIDRVEFSDGTVWDKEALEEMLRTGNERDQGLCASSEGSYLNGQGGDDTLYGGDGDDILTGGTGNDIIISEKGSDTYIFAAGDGHDIIYNQTDNHSIDILKFGEGIFSHDINIVFNQTDDLILQIANTGDSVTIANFFKSAASRIDRIEFSDGTVWLAEGIISATQQGNAGDQRLYASAAVSTLYAGAGDDSLKGSDSDDTLYGEEGDDRLYGRKGNDVLSGGQGNDYLSGGSGSDIYLFSRGDGQDIIDNREKYYGDTACLRFDATIAAEDLLLSVKNGALVLKIRDTEDQITLLDYFNDNTDYSSTIEFSNGEIWQREDILLLLSLSGGSEADMLYARETGSQIDAGAGNDHLFGSAESDALLGEAGNDMLYGREGDDYLDGGSGDDSLYGGAGNDTLAGGQGADYLAGGHGNDTYIFNLGDGHDIIDNRVEGWSEYDDADTLKFGAGINPDTLTLSASNGDLVLSLPNGSDSVTLKGYFTLGYFSDFEVEKILAVEFIEFANGHIWSYNKVREMVMNGDDTDQELYALPEGNTLLAGGGDDQLYGRTGDDLLFGEAGSDRLYGRGGNDILVGGAGNDTLVGGMGADTYLFNRGDGQDIINDRQRFFSRNEDYFSDDDENTPQVHFDYAQYDKYLDYTEHNRYPDTDWDDEEDEHLEESRFINDTLRFGETIGSQDVDISASGNDLVLSIRGSTDSVTIQNYLTKESVYLIEQIVFADRTVWTPEYIFSVLESTPSTGEVTAAQTPSLQLMMQSVSQFMGDDDDGMDGANITSPLALSASTTSGWNTSARL